MLRYASLLHMSQRLRLGNSWIIWITQLTTPKAICTRTGLSKSCSSLHFHTAHLNVVFSGVAGHLQYVQTPLGATRDWQHSIKDLQYVWLYIPRGWWVVKMQWEISGKECYGFMHVRYHLSKSGEDIQTEIHYEEARACKWGFHVCGLWLFFSHFVTPVFFLTLSLPLLRPLKRRFYEPNDSNSTRKNLEKPGYTWLYFHLPRTCWLK